MAPSTKSKKGKYTNFVNTTKITDAEINLIRKSMKRTYEEFKSKVAKGRNKSKDYIQKIAQGKVYTGKQALDNGLVDRIGHFSEVINDLKQDSNIKNASITIYPKPKSFFEKLSEGNPFMAKSFDINAKINEILDYEPKPKYIFPYYNILKKGRK